MSVVLPAAPAPLVSDRSLFAGHPLHRRSQRWLSGALVEVRPVLPGDAPAIAALVRELSPTSSYRRFLAPVLRLSAAQLAAVVDVDHHDRETLVALVRRGRRVHLAGFAQYVRVSDVSAEMAVVVADRWQGRGVGRFLLQQLIAAATEERFEWLTGDALSENKAIIGLVRSLATDTDVVLHGSTSTLLVRLDQGGVAAADPAGASLLTA